MQDQTALPQEQHHAVLKTRLLIGLLQGISLFWLMGNNEWLAPRPMLWAALSSIAIFLPPLLVVGFGHLKPRRIFTWALAITLMLIIVSAYSEWRWIGAASNVGRDLTSRHFWPYIFMLAPLVFIVWSLIHASELDQRWPAHYATYFETSWKLAVQIKFASAFLAVFWLVLWLGAGLFKLIDLSFLLELIIKRWFWAPASCVAFTAGLHLADARPHIVSGIRNLLLTMLSWLLPLLTVIVIGFLLAIVATGLEPLWKTRFASSLLLGTCAALIILINAAYQAGSQAEIAHAVIRRAAIAACPLLLPLALIAAYALALRVDQYGWTPDRLIAASATLVALLYAGGYLWAALDPKPRKQGKWLVHIAPTNIYAALGISLLALALLSPLADPARISVNSQISRLQAGTIKLDEFDFKFLRFDGARFGTEALEELRASTDPLISSKAAAAQKTTGRWENPAPTPSTLAERITLKSPGSALPVAFLKQDWLQGKERWQLPGCMSNTNSHCNAYLGDYSGRGLKEVLLVPDNYGDAVLFSDTDKEWRAIASFSRPRGCPAIDDALLRGDVKQVKALVPDLLIAGQRLRAREIVINASSENCPPENKPTATTNK